MFEFEEPEQASDPETDLEIESISNDKEILAYGLYVKMLNYLAHYNAIKIKYKLLALTWILTTFIGFGYLLSGKEIELPIDPLLTISLISVLSTIGILLLGFFDIAIYHRLIEAIFIEALKFEDKFSFLRRCNTNAATLLISKHSHPVIFDGLYYATLTFILLCTGSVSLYSFFDPINHHTAIIAASISFVLILITEYLVLYFTKQSSLKELFE